MLSTAHTRSLLEQRYDATTEWRFGGCTTPTDREELAKTEIERAVMLGPRNNVDETRVMAG